MYVNPKDAAKVQAAKKAAYGHQAPKVVKPKKGAAAAAMAKMVSGK